MTTLTKYLQALLEKTDIKVAFFGDTYISDITSTEEFNVKNKANKDVVKPA
jgi:hypothetical protein